MPCRIRFFDYFVFRFKPQERYFLFLRHENLTSVWGWQDQIFRLGKFPYRYWRRSELLAQILLYRQSYYLHRLFPPFWPLHHQPKILPERGFSIANFLYWLISQIHLVNCSLIDQRANLHIFIKSIAAFKFVHLFRQLGCKFFTN